MSNPVVDAAKENIIEDVVTLSTGIKVIIKPVPVALLQDVVGRIRDPEIPWEMNEVKGVKEPNEHSPQYRKELAEANALRGRASLDCMIMFGIDLIDAIPETNEWIEKLSMLQRLGHLDLSDYDLKNKIDIEFLYKKYCVVGNADFVLLAGKSGIKKEDIDTAAASF